MTLGHVTKTGNISIPKGWRDELGIVPNSTVILHKRGEEIVIEPLNRKDIKLTLDSIDKEIEKKGIKFSRKDAIKDDLYD